jgi:hypothetical protein
MNSTRSTLAFLADGCRVDVSRAIERQRRDFFLGRAVEHKPSPAGEMR